MQEDRLITVAIHTYDYALKLRAMLERENIEVVFQNVNLQTPVVSPGVRMRIHERDLPLALRIIENPHIVTSTDSGRQQDSHYILVPVDFKDYSKRAAAAAVVIAASLKADVCLLHSYIDPDEESAMQLTASLNYGVGLNENERQELERDAMHELEKFAESLLADMRSGKLPPVRISCKVVEGVPEDSIAEYAEVNPPILTVMGTRGCLDKEQQLIGSVTAEVLDKCHNSVLAIPDGYRERTDCSRDRRIVFFSNLDQEDFLAIDSLCRIFPDGKLTVTLVHIPAKRRNLFSRSADLDLDSMLEYCSDHYPAYTFKKDSIDVAVVKTDENLRDAIDANYMPDLIVIPNKRANSFMRLFSPSLSHRILFCTEVPVLAIPV